MISSRTALQPLDLSLDEQRRDAVRMMYCDAVSYLPDDILCKVDRASMAVSLEVHCPFLDHRFAELAARIPIGMKIRGRHPESISCGKCCTARRPRTLFERPKSGFGIPVGEWIKGPLARLGRSRFSTAGGSAPRAGSMPI